MYDTIPPQILLKEIKEEECGTKNDRTDIAAYCNIAVVVPAGSHLVGYFLAGRLYNRAVIPPCRGPPFVLLNDYLQNKLGGSL